MRFLNQGMEFLKGVAKALAFLIGGLLCIVGFAVLLLGPSSEGLNAAGLKSLALGIIFIGLGALLVHWGLKDRKDEYENGKDVD